jgi:hypothetical protein
VGETDEHDRFAPFRPSGWASSASSFIWWNDLHTTTCSGVLGHRRHHARTWSKEILWEVMTSCVIMHNMIVEEKRNESAYD